MASQIQIVDVHNQPICAGTKTEAWQLGLYHQIVRIILRDAQGNILLQKRGLTMEIYPNLWTDSASGHVDYGEEPEVAAARELREEIGVSAPLKYVDTFLTELLIRDKKVNTFNIVYIGEWSESSGVTIDKNEVSDVRWTSIGELRDDLQKHPEKYTPFLASILEKYLL